MRNIKKAPNSQQAQHLSRQAMYQLRTVINVVRNLFKNVNVVIQTTCMGICSIYSQFIFKLEYFVAPSSLSKTGSSAQLAYSDTKKSVMAMGGDYSKLLDVLKFGPPDQMRANIPRMAVGFSFDFENIVKLSSTSANLSLLQIPFIGEVIVSLTSHPVETAPDARQSAIVDVMKTCMQLRAAGFSSSPVLNKHASAILGESSEQFLAAHHPIPRVICLLKHVKGSVTNGNSDLFNRISFEIYFRIASTGRTDCRIVEVPNSSPDFSIVVMTIQELCSSVTPKVNLLKSSGSGVFDLIKSHTLATASVILGQHSTPILEPSNVKVSEDPAITRAKQQDSQLTPQMAPALAPIEKSTPAVSSSHTIGGLSAYTDVLWFCEERVPMKEKRRYENQMVAALSSKFKCLNPSVHVDVLMLELDSPALGTFANWLSGQIHLLTTFVNQQQSVTGISNVLSSWSTSAKCCPEFEKIVTERHPRSRFYLKNQIPEIIDLIVTRVNTHTQMSMPSPGTTSASSNKFHPSLTSSSSGAGFNPWQPIFMLFAMKDSSSQVVM